LREAIPPMVGVWLANLIYFIIGALLTFAIIEQ